MSEPPVIAIVDDDASIREALQSLLRPVGWRAAGFASAEDFLQSGQGQTTACLLLDGRLPGMSGLDLQRQLGASHAHLFIIFRTSARSLHIVEGGMAASMEALDSHRITDIRERFAGGRYAREVQHCTTHGLAGIIGTSATLKRIVQAVELVTRTDATVLIHGETGTGKELSAAIHARSVRCRHPLVSVNCTAIPADLFESEFFGHVKGAFTGALHDQVSRFQQADGDTLFLDEVGKLPLLHQAKPIRVLLDGHFERAGEERTRTVNVRVLAATNRDLRCHVDAGRFREDLYYRLSVFPIAVSPLRARKDDIPALAAHVLRLPCTRLHRAEVRLTSEDIAVLQRYDRPGNVRELQHVIERTVILASGPHLHLDIPVAQGAPPAAGMQSAAQGAKAGAVSMEVVPYTALKRRERENMQAALEQSR